MWFRRRSPFKSAAQNLDHDVRRHKGLVDTVFAIGRLAPQRATHQWKRGPDRGQTIAKLQHGRVARVESALMHQEPRQIGLNFGVKYQGVRDIMRFDQSAQGQIDELIAPDR